MKQILFNPSYFLLFSIFLFPTITTLADFLKGGSRSSITRYYLSSAIGIELAVAYLITTQITEMKRKKIGEGIFIVMTSLGVISGVIMTQNSTWWNKYNLSPTLEIAPLIKSSQSTLVITDIDQKKIGDVTYDIGSLICLSYQLDPQIKYLLVVPPNLPQISQNEFSNIFLYNPSQTLTNSWDNDPNWKLKLVYQPPDARMFLWKLEPRARSPET